MNNKKPKERTQHAILLTFDEKYLEYGIACLHSMHLNYPNHPDIFVSYEGGTAEDSNRIFNFDRVYPIDFSDADTRIEGLDYGLVGSKQVYMRFYAWSAFFDDYDKVMYLDADCLILNPLDHMFQKDDFYIIKDLMTKAADCWVFKLEYEMDPTLNTALEKDGLRYSEMQYQMCNAGIFVIPKSYRTKQYWDELWQIARRYNTYLKLGDQSVISMWCAIHGIEGQKHFEDNLQTAGLFYFNLDIPIKDLKNYPIEKESLNIFHFSYLKPHVKVLERYRANYSLYYESFKKYQYYLNVQSSTNHRHQLLDIHDISMVWIILSDTEEEYLKARKYLLSYIENTYEICEFILIEYGREARFKDNFEGRKNLRYQYVNSENFSLTSDLINFSISLSKSRKVFLFNGLLTVHPKALLRASMAIDKGESIILPYDKKLLFNIDFRQFKKKRGKLDFFPDNNDPSIDWSAYALHLPNLVNDFHRFGFCLLVDRIQYTIDYMEVTPSKILSKNKEQLLKHISKIQELPYPLYSFEPATEKS